MELTVKRIHWRIWFVRKIRKGGRVKIGGKWYRVVASGKGAIPYDGRLDGMFYLFARYKEYPVFLSERYKDFIYCWGPAENRGKDPDECIDDPQVVDGYYNWPLWYDENTHRDEIRKRWEI